jgi:hypothetical protein
VAAKDELVLVASDEVTLGFVPQSRLWEEPRALGDVLLDLHWLAESGKRHTVARELEALGPEALSAPEARELVCRVAFSGLADPGWVERLAAQGCPGRPELGGATTTLAVGGCPAGPAAPHLRTAAPMGTAWACASQSGAELYVADHRGTAARLGSVVVAAGGSCPTTTLDRVLPVGLGACVAASTADEDCATATGTRLERLFCLPSGGAAAPATEILLAYFRIESAGWVDEDCLFLRDRVDGDDLWDETLCAVERERHGERARFAVVREEKGALLCVQGAHEDRGPRNVAYRFLPGQIVELPAWPSVCDVDDY